MCIYEIERIQTPNTLAQYDPLITQEREKISMMNHELT